MENNTNLLSLNHQNIDIWKINSKKMLSLNHQNIDIWKINNKHVLSLNRTKIVYLGSSVNYFDFDMFFIRSVNDFNFNIF